jgi:hypothetical protein
MTPDDWRKEHERELDYERENKKIVIATIVALIAGIAILSIMFIALQEVATWTP